MKTTKEQREKVREILTGFPPQECHTANYFVRDCLDDLDEAEKRIEILEKGLEVIAGNLVTEGDCPACEFGPVQATEHHAECPYLIASQTLAKSRGVGK